MEHTSITPSFPGQFIRPQNAFDNRVELILDDQGMIRDFNIPSGDLFGYRRSASAWGNISELIPAFSSLNLMCDGQINPSLHFLSHMGHRFKLISFDGKIFDVKLFIRMIKNDGQHNVRVTIFPF